MKHFLLTVLVLACGGCMPGDPLSSAIDLELYRFRQLSYHRVVFVGRSLPTAQSTKAEPATYRCELLLIVSGSDGSLSVTREVRLPFVLKAGDSIDLFTVRRVNWSTKREMFLVTLDVVRDSEPAREVLRRISPGVQWQEVFFIPKGK